MMRAILLILLCVGGAADLHCADLTLELRGTRWIAYAPTGYYPSESPPVLPSVTSLKADLLVLRDAGFTGLVTYGTVLDAIPDIAESLGFRAVLLGIWNIFDREERAKALRIVSRHNRLIVGIVVGNEGVLNGRYTPERVCEAMTAIRADAQKPVTTTEPADVILSEPTIAKCSDFLTVNAHPYFSGRKTPDAAVQWTEETWDAIREQYPNQPLLLKEVGLPTAGDKGEGEELQALYYERLAKTRVVFSYFEAFDATPRFKQGPIEQSWGLWHSDRSPKPAVYSLPWKHELR